MIDMIEKSIFVWGGKGVPGHFMNDSSTILNFFPSRQNWTL